MGLSGLDEPRVVRASAAVVSIAVHLGLVAVFLLSGSPNDGVESGDTPSTELVLIEADDAQRSDGADLPPLEPAVPISNVEQQLQAENQAPEPARLAVIEPAPPLIEVAELVASPAPLLETEIAVADTPPVAPTIPMSEAEQTVIEKRLARLAQKVAAEPQAHVAWEEDGKQYSAVLIQQRANDGAALDRVIAEVSSAAHGRKLTTRVSLKRLAFSHFTQMVDRWDPMVQLHDDEIDGRFHSNSQFSVMYDSRTAPKFLGKVTTAARSFDTQSTGRRRDKDVFRGGVETRAGRIPLPEDLRPFEWAPHHADTRIHQLPADTRIRFYDDGGYALHIGGSPAAEMFNAHGEHPVFFIGARGATLYVQGVLAGEVLIYSPHRIIIEGDLTYAHDPREVNNSPDFLGLVCDRYIEVAPPHVTGPGDLEIDAAIFAGRRFVVSSINHRRAATLRIFGSLAAGSLSASEPRYATKIEYDDRFEHRRPPGFPSTDRYEVENWNGEWTEEPLRVAGETF